ncbi:Preprotein translocase subunit SCY2, chloroplastic [Capsicum annuum]|nr:Preprotein translocase subunit SCY2, chloroplastic [Capsicum annuum]
MWAVVVSEGCRKVKLQYYGFKVASAARKDSPVPEVEPYIPFNINPAGMQPILVTSYLLALPGILASFYAVPWIEALQSSEEPKIPVGLIKANMPKEIADYLNKIGARIPSIKPGKATIAYLTKIQASTRFWGGLLFSVLATTSTVLDCYLRRINEGYTIGLTSVLIIATNKKIVSAIVQQGHKPTVGLLY